MALAIFVLLWIHFHKELHKYSPVHLAPQRRDYMLQSEEESIWKVTSVLLYVCCRHCDMDSECRFWLFFYYYSETLLIVKMGASLEKYIVDVC